jgi:hypothetical protein
MSSRIDRRAFFSLGAMFALTGCATAFTDNPAIPIIRSVHVSGHQNLWVVNVGPYVERNLVRLLGNRYQPGAKGGATLQVELTGISFPTSDDAFGGDSVDALEGRVTLVSASGGVLKSFPLLASTASVDAEAEIPEPTPRRYDWMASTFAYWTLSKLT